uniref:Uncharacterized protein n=1 Tax=Cacopsylla melanoneura TaxID=428564 RepID=A0A8D8R737_9HEMI
MYLVKGKGQHLFTKESILQFLSIHSLLYYYSYHRRVASLVLPGLPFLLSSYSVGTSLPYFFVFSTSLPSFFKFGNSFLSSYLVPPFLLSSNSELPLLLSSYSLLSVPPFLLSSNSVLSVPIPPFFFKYQHVGAQNGRSR